MWSDYVHWLVTSLEVFLMLASCLDTVFSTAEGGGYNDHVTFVLVPDT